MISEFKSNMKKYVKVMNLGELHWLLGIEIVRNQEARTISMSQCSYIDSITRRFGFEDLKPLSLPMDPNSRLSVMQSPLTDAQYVAMQNIPYCEDVSAMMYTMLGTRPDILYAVTTLSKFSSNPGLAHWEAVKRVYQYLAGTRELWLTFGSIEKEMVGYANADGSMNGDRYSLLGCVFLVDGGAVSWSTKRQEIVSLLTTESEYVAATHTTKEALWLCSLIGQIFGTFNDTTTLFTDNQSAIALMKDHQYHVQLKHINMHFHFIRWIVEDGKIRLIYCPTGKMVTSTLTKALPSPKVKHFAAKLSLRTV